MFLLVVTAQHYQQCIGACSCVLMHAQGGGGSRRACGAKWIPERARERLRKNAACVSITGKLLTCVCDVCFVTASLAGHGLALLRARADARSHACARLHSPFPVKQACKVCACKGMTDGMVGRRLMQAGLAILPPPSLPACPPQRKRASCIDALGRPSGWESAHSWWPKHPPLHTHPMHPTRARRLLSSPTLSLAQPTAAHAPRGRAMQVTACATHLGENKQRQEGSTRRRHVRSAQASCTGASQHQQRPAPVASTLLPGREGVTMLTNDRMVYGVALTAAPLSIQPSSSRCLSSDSHHLALQVQASACLSLCSRALPAPALAPRPLGCSSPPLLR